MSKRWNRHRFTATIITIRSTWRRRCYQPTEENLITVSHGAFHFIEDNAFEDQLVCIVFYISFSQNSINWSQFVYLED